MTLGWRIKQTFVREKKRENKSDTWLENIKQTFVREKKRENKSDTWLENKADLCESRPL